MIYICGKTGNVTNVAESKDLVSIMKRVKQDNEYGAIFKLDMLDCAYISYSTDLNTNDGKKGGFCLLWSNGNGYKAIKKYAYKNAVSALNALFRI